MTGCQKLSPASYVPWHLGQSSHSERARNSCEFRVTLAGRCATEINLCACRCARSGHECFQRVDENPIRLDVAIPASHVIASQRMIQILRGQVMPGDDQINHRPELAQSLPAFFQPFDVLLELARPAECPHKPRSAYSSRLLAKCFTFFPALLSSRTFVVSGVGILTSNGNPRRSWICR